MNFDNIIHIIEIVFVAIIIPLLKSAISTGIKISEEVKLLGMIIEQIKINHIIYEKRLADNERFITELRINNARHDRRESDN